MAVTAEELNVIIGANVQGLTKAIDRAERRIERFSKQSQKQMSSTAKAFDNLGKAAKKLGPLIATALTVQTIRSLVDTGIEIENLSRVSGIAAERFQELSYAARQFGVQQEKFADIIKDVNDKFGDYIATGAGPLADFFENIAPKVGVTAEQFAKLSGPQALQLYVSSLEKAGVSQQQMTFYMEALASDATLLIDMFKNNGAAANAMADELRTAGGVMDEEFVKNSKEAKRQLDLISRVISAELSDAIVHVTPLIKDTAMFIGSMAQAIGKAYNMVREFFGYTSHMNMTQLEQAGVDSLKKQKIIQDQIFARRMELQKLGKDEYSDAQLKRLRDMLQIEKERGLEILNNIMMLEEREALLKEKQDKTVVPKTADTGVATSRVETASQRERREAREAEIEGLLAEADALRATQDPLFAYQQAMEKIAPLLEGNTIAHALLSEQIKKTYHEAVQSMDPMFQATEELGDSLEQHLGTAFEGFISGTMSAQDVFKTFAAAVIKDIIRIMSQMNEMNAAAGAVGGQKTSLIGSIIRGLSGLAGSTTIPAGSAALPGQLQAPSGSGIGPIKPSAIGGPALSGRRYLVGERGPEVLTMGQGASGYITPNRGLAGDQTTVNMTLNITTGVAQTVRAELLGLMPAIQQQTVAAVANQKSRGGARGSRL